MILQLLQTGRLGKLEIGMPIDDALAYLGIPDGFETLEDFRKLSPQLWEMSRQDERLTLGGMKHGSLITMFKDKKLKTFSVLVNGDFGEIPHSLGDGWLDDFRQMSHQMFQAFVIEHELDHLRYARHRMPHAWVSESPLLEVHLFFGTPPRIKSIQSGSPFS